MLRHREDRITIDTLGLEAHQEAMSIPLVGFVTAAVISVGMWVLIVWTLWNLVR